MAVPFWRVSFWDMCFHFSQLSEIFSLSVMKLNGKQYKSHGEVLDCKAGMPTEMVLNITNTSGEHVCGMLCSCVLVFLCSCVLVTHPEAVHR